MPRYFEFKDDKSSKFWEIELEGNSYSVRFGKIGTAGQTQVKAFADDAAAQKEYNKLVAEKVKKGYIEQSSGASETSQPASKPVARMAAQKLPPPPTEDEDLNEDKEEEDDDDDDDDDDDEPRVKTKGTTAGARRFEFEDDKSSKFWQISLDGASFTVTYGRIGTDGQTQIKEFDSDAKAQKEYEKLVQEKLKKGYEEVDSDEDDESDEDGDDDDDDESRFAGLDIEEWDQETGIEDPGAYAFKVGLTYEEDDEEGLKWPDKFAAFLNDPKSGKVTHLVVGSWGGQSMCEGEDSSLIVEALVAAREQLPNLIALYIADVTYEDCEISWIQQSDMSPLLDAYPNLKHFRVRGGTNLELGTLKHKHLQSLVIESGGLSTDIVRSVAGAQLPELVHLELWLGTDNYGGDYTLDDLRPIIEGKQFPKLQYLGLRNSCMTDQIALALADSPILKRIRILDLSMGTLGDKGAKALLSSPSIKKLGKLRVGHHYMSEAMVESMNDLGNVEGLDEVEEADDYDDDEDESAGRYCQVSE